MPRIALAEGASVHCIVDDFLWPWVDSTPVLMMHGFARNATFWNRWVPAIAETHRVYRPDLFGCGLSDQPPIGYHYTPETIGAQILAVLDGLLWNVTRSTRPARASVAAFGPAGSTTVAI